MHYKVSVQEAMPHSKLIDIGDCSFGAQYVAWCTPPSYCVFIVMFCESQDFFKGFFGGVHLYKIGKLDVVGYWTWYVNAYLYKEGS